MIFTSNDSYTSQLTFDSFIPSATNQQAFDTARAIADDSSDLQGSVIVIWGERGIGKTHLLRAVQNHVEASHPAMRVSYLGEGDFYSMAMALLSNRNFPEEFLSAHEADSVFMVDDINYLTDIEYLADTPQTFSLLHDLVSRISGNGGIVLCAGTKADIGFKTACVNPRMSIAIPMQPSPQDVRARIVEKLLHDRDEALTLPEDVKQMLAERFENINTLKKETWKLIYTTALQGIATLSLEQAVEVLDKPRKHSSPAKEVRLDPKKRRTEVNRLG